LFVSNKEFKLSFTFSGGGNVVFGGVRDVKERHCVTSNLSKYKENEVSLSLRSGGLQFGQPGQIVPETHFETTRAQWTTVVAQAVAHLLCKCEALSSNPVPPKKGTPFKFAGRLYEGSLREVSFDLSLKDLNGRN
jgi:hypothetical protein